MTQLPRVDDRLLWLGLGLFFFVAAKGIRYAIKDVIRLTEIEDYQEPSVGASHLPENDISLDDLKILADSPNPNIANAAISLAVERFLRDDDAYRSVVDDFEQQRDLALGKRAKQALTFLRELAAASGHPGLNRQPWSPMSMSRSTSPSLMALEVVRHFPGLDGWLDAPPASGFDDGVEEVLIPSEENPVAGWTSVPRERPAVEGSGELERRRRRREAMVLRIGDGGVEEGDIIRPNLDE